MLYIIKRTAIAILLLLICLFSALSIPSVAQKVVPILITLAIESAPSISAHKIIYEKEKVILENITIKSKTDKSLSIKRIDLAYDLSQSIKKLGLIFKVQLHDAKIENDISFNAEANIAFKMTALDITNAQIHFSNTSSINFEGGYRKKLGRLNNVYINGSINQIAALTLEKLLRIMFDHDSIDFVRNQVKAGDITGNWKVNLDQKFLHDKQVNSEHFKGQFKLLDVSLNYHQNFPTLTNINADVTMDGSKLHFQISQGASNKISIVKGDTILDWAEGDDSKVLIHAVVKSQAKEILDFVPKNAITDLQKASIDLTQVKGDLNGKVDITVPLKPGTPNIYDVNTTIDNVSLDLLENYFHLSSGKLTGKFDGKEITIQGSAKVNEFLSKIMYHMNLDADKDHDHMLQLQVICKNLENESIKHGITFKNGSSIVNVNYTKKDQKANLTLNSDLKNLEFSFDKIGMHKPLGDKARITINNTDESPFPSKFSISLKGDNGLRLIGTAAVDHRNKTLKFSEAKYGNTDLKANFTFAKDAITADIKGKSLDLSSSPMMHYLEKDSNGQDVDLQVKIDNIILKQSVILDNFAMRIRCNKTQCFEGGMSANIGARTLNMDLDTANNTEEWKIVTTNAGALLKGIGLYNNMKAGNLLLTLNTSRKEIHQGQQIPILEGKFILEKFVTHNMPILTRLVSFISFPGLMSLVRNNNDISFHKMSGTFSYRDSIIKIKNCEAEGGFFDFSASGSINTILRQIQLKGSVVPSLYGINTLVRNVPIIGKVLSFGHRKGIVYAPYSINEKY